MRVVLNTLKALQKALKKKKTHVMRVVLNWEVLRTEERERHCLHNKFT
jgi:hypothetical protein